MFKRQHFGLALAFAAVAALAGCGSSSSGPSFAGTISNAAAADAGSNASGFAGDLATTFNFGTGPSVGLSARISPTAVAVLNHAWMAAGGRAPHYRTKRPGLASPVFMSSAATCVNDGQEVITGDTLDTDGDGIPNNVTATISCDTTLSNGVTISEHANIHIQDIDALYGYEFSVNITITESHADTSISISESGNDNATFTAASANDNLNLTISEVTKTGSLSVGGAVHEDWNATYTPSSGTIDYASALPDGHISFSGGFYVTNAADGTQNFNFHILTAVPLHFVASCWAANDDPSFDDGEIQGEFNGSASVGFTATFTACNTDPTVVGTGNAT